MAKYIKDLPLGAKVKFGSYNYGGGRYNLPWTIVSKNHRNYPSNSITLWCDEGVDFRPISYNTELNHESLAPYGIAKYDTTSMDLWFNSNKPAGEWYHIIDQYDGNNARDVDKNLPGFLHDFTQDEQECMLNTNVDIYHHNTPNQIIQRKVFLPSLAELGVKHSQETNGNYVSFAELGHKWDISLKEDDITNTRMSTPSINKRGCAASYASVICRNLVDKRSVARDGREDYIWMNCCLARVTTRYSYGLYLDFIYVKQEQPLRPVINIKDTTKVSNTTDSEGYYTVIFNTPPTKPSYIRSNTSNILGGNTASISWGTSSDPDGDTVKYILQRKVNGASGWTTIRTGLRTTSYTDSITFGWKTVQYRVAAYDNEIPNDNNSYTLSSVYTITNNTPPTISGSDKDLGTFSNTGTTIAYIVKDAENNDVNVNISIDGKSLSNLSVILGLEYEIHLTDEAWITLNNGRHSVKIEATDSQGASATRTYTFIKSVTKMTFMNKVPYASTNMPGRAKIYVNRQIPTNAIFKVYACNNAFDANPTWEDVTSSVTNNLVYMFTNKTKTATDWGVKIKVVVDRNNTAGECYISEVGGNFA